MVVRSVERLASQHLDVDQVEVDRMGITCQVGDLPDFGRALIWRFRRGGHVGTPKAAIHRLVCPEQLDQTTISIKGLVQRQLTNAHSWWQMQLTILDRCARGYQERCQIRCQIRVFVDEERGVLAGRRDDLEPHDLAGVWPETRFRLCGIAWSAREIVVARITHRERRGGIVVEDDFLSSETLEVHEKVPALSRGGNETASEGLGIERLVGWDIHRSRQESALRPDHLKVRARLVGRLSLTVERDAVRTPIIDIELQVEEPCLASVENAQAIAPCFDARFGIHRAVGEHGITEHLWDNRGIGRQAQWMGSQLPTILLVFVRVPQAAHAFGAGPGRILVLDVRSNKNLVLDDDGNFTSTVLNKVRQAQVTQMSLKAVADDVSAGDTCIGIEPSEIDGVVVVPGKPSTLIVGIVVLPLTWLETGIEEFVDVARCTMDARTVLAIRGIPGERSTITDPGCEPTMDMGSGRILVLPRLWEVGAGVDRQDMLRWQRVRERDLDRGSSLHHENAAEVLLGLRSTAQWHDRVVAPQASSGRGEGVTDP